MLEQQDRSNHDRRFGIDNGVGRAQIVTSNGGIEPNPVGYGHRGEGYRFSARFQGDQ